MTIPQLREQGYLAFYVAIGCQGGRLPGVPGEDAEGTDIAVHFLHEALADETQRMEGSVVVVGGGNVAVDCARTAVRFGASKVSMVCLESRETMPAAADEIAEAGGEAHRDLRRLGSEGAAAKRKRPCDRRCVQKVPAHHRPGDGQILRRSTTKTRRSRSRRITSCSPSVRPSNGAAC